MGRSDVIRELKSYFGIKELVCPDMYKKFGELCWQFFDRDFLETLLVIRRDILKVPMVCNNWANGGNYAQRGFRCNLCQISRDKTVAGKLYASSHCNGAAGDFTVEGMTAEEARQKIINNKDILPVNIRLEDDVSWLHLDIYDQMNGQKVHLFKS